MPAWQTVWLPSGIAFAVALILRRRSVPQCLRQVSQVRDTQPKAESKPKAKTESKVTFLTEDQVEEIKGWVKAYDKRDDLIAAFKKQFKIMAPRIADRIQFPEHKEFIEKYIAENPV